MSLALYLKSWSYTINIHPNVISAAELVKTIGHNLNGRNLILNPVNTEMTARTIRNPDELRYTMLETMLLGSMAVAIPTNRLTNIRAMPSVIHSMAIIFRLSGLISPNPLITDFVGKRWAMPQTKGSAAPE